MAITTVLLMAITTVLLMAITTVPAPCSSRPTCKLVQLPHQQLERGPGIEGGEVHIASVSIASVSALALFLQAAVCARQLPRHRAQLLQISLMLTPAPHKPSVVLVPSSIAPPIGHLGRFLNVLLRWRNQAHYGSFAEHALAVR
jgi:hypothetical protein